MLKFLGIYIIIAASFLKPVYAQNMSGVEVLKDISSKLNKVKDYSYDVNIQVYSVTNMTTPSNTSNCITFKHNDNYYVNAMNKTTIITDKYSILIDEKQRLIMYRGFESKPEDFKSKQELSMVNVDSLLKKSNIKIVVIKNDPDFYVLKMSNVGDGVSDLNMTYDKKLNILKRLEYYYDKETQKENGNLKVIINYKKNTTCCSNSASTIIFVNGLGISIPFCIWNIGIRTLC